MTTPPNPGPYPHQPDPSYYQPPPPRRRHTVRNLLVAVLGVIVAAAVVGGVAAGSGDDDQSPTAVTSPATDAGNPAPQGPPQSVPAEPADDGLNERGNVPAQLGEPTTIVEGGVHVATVTITAVQPDPACENPLGASSERGHWLLVSLTVQTTADVQGTWLFNPLYLSVIGPDGLSEEFTLSIGLDCGGNAPSNLGPAVGEEAQIVVDTSYTTGSLVYRPFLADSGYEWPF